MRYVTGADEVTIKELKRSMMSALSETAWQWRRKRLLQTLDEAGVDGPERLKALIEDDLDRGTRAPLIRWTFTFEGSLEIIKAACTASDTDPTKFLGDLPQEKVESLARELIGLRERLEVEPTGEAIAGA